MTPDAPTIKAFISHSWKDKALARRISRRLTHRGIDIWLDEQQMRVGHELSKRVMDAIRDSTHFVLLWTGNAAASAWVAKELKFAQSAYPRPAIVQLLADPAIEDAPLGDIITARIDDPYRIEARLDEIAEAILGKPPPVVVSRERLKRDLNSVAEEAPGLRVMIDRLLENQELTNPQLSSFTVAEQERHEAEFALITLYELMPSGSGWRFKIALAAAELFRRHEVGYPVLERQVSVEPMDTMHVNWLFDFLRHHQPGPAAVDAVLRLFERTVSRVDTVSSKDAPAVDEKFAEFVEANFEQFSPAQVQRAIGVAMAPSRGPGKGTAFLSFELFKRVPDSIALRTQWFYWINAGAFFAKDDVEHPMHPASFFELMNEAHEKQLAQFEEVMDDFENCFRSLTGHGGEKELMSVAIILDAANGTRYHRLQRLAAQLLLRIESGEFRTAQNAHGRLVSAIWDYADSLAHDPDNPPKDSLVARIVKGDNLDYTPGLRDLGILKQ